MGEKQKSMESLCSFYVSDWHMVTMILPYINTQINQNNKIITILEKGIEKKILELLEKLNLKNEEKIKNIDWNMKNGYKYEVIEDTLRIKEKKEIIVFVSGSKEFIDRTNQNIKLWYSKQVRGQLKVINSYEVTDFNCNIQEILDYHDKILNTSGEHCINEIFDGYEPKEKRAK